MKKYIIVIIIITFIITFGILFMKNNNSKTIEQILNVDFNDIAYVQTGGAKLQDSQYNLKQFVNEYKYNKYTKFKGSEGSSAHIYFICYDNNDDVLFTVVETGNRNLVFLKQGKFDISNDSDNLYQLSK